MTQQNESPEAGRQSVSVGQAYGRLKRSIDNLDSDTCLSPPFASFLAGGQASQTCYLAYCDCSRIETMPVTGAFARSLSRDLRARLRPATARRHRRCGGRPLRERWKTERMIRRYAAVTDQTLRVTAEAVSEKRADGSKSPNPYIAAAGSPTLLGLKLGAAQ